MTIGPEIIPPKSAGAIMRDLEFDDLAYGDKALVVGPKAQQYGVKRVEFLCHAENVMTGARWLEGWGGSSGHQHTMAFKLDELKVV